MLNIVLFGPPGAGKGTQSEYIIEKYQLVHLSTGDILRGEIAKQSDLGLKAKEYMNKGELVPDALVIDMISLKLDANAQAKGFIFDGFPRTSAQAKALDILLEEKKTPISAMVALEVEEQELINRLSERGKVSGRADDQDLSIIANRIKVYNKETAPLIEYYKAQNKFISIYGMGTIDEIFGRISQAIDKL